MRVALLHYAAHPVVGGVESVMREHSRLMARSGHQVRVIAGRGAQVDPEVEFTRLALVDSLAPEVLNLKPALDAGRVPPEFQDLSKAIEDQLQENLTGFDWLFVHNVCSLNKNLAATSALRRIAAAAGPRLVLWHHDLAWATPRYRSELHEGDPWDLLRSDWPDVIQVTVSVARRLELAGLLGVPLERIRVIPNGIDPFEFLGIDAATAGLAGTLGLLDADPLLLLPARVTPRKNIEMALRILDHLRHRSPRALLLVTGPVGAHNRENRTYLEFSRAVESVARDRRPGSVRGAPPRRGDFGRRHEADLSPCGCTVASQLGRRIWHSHAGSSTCTHSSVLFGDSASCGAGRGWCRVLRPRRRSRRRSRADQHGIARLTATTVCASA